MCDYARIERLLQEADDISAEVDELERLDGVPPGKQRRGLRIIEGGRSAAR